MRVVHAKPILVGISLMLISVMFNGQSSAKIDPETIVGLWLFDQDSGQTVNDSSGNNNNGRFVKNPKWVKGKFGNALEFDAGPYVEVPLSKTNDFTGWEQISVCAWYKTDVLSDEKWMIRNGQVMIGQTAAPNEWSIAIQNQVGLGLILKVSNQIFLWTERGLDTCGGCLRWKFFQTFCQW